MIHYRASCIDRKAAFTESLGGDVHRGMVTASIVCMLMKDEPVWYIGEKPSGLDQITRMSKQENTLHTARISIVS